MTITSCRHCKTPVDARQATHCSTCGRLIGSLQEGDGSGFYQGARWCTKQCSVDVVIAEEVPQGSWFIADLEGVKAPLDWGPTAFGSWEMFFRHRHPRLPEYLLAQRNENRLQLAVRLLHSAFRLFERIHQRKRCVGDLDLHAIACAEKEGVLSLELFQTRPLLPFGKSSHEALPRVVGIDAPEVRNCNASEWSPATDVFVLGAFFVAILTEREHFEDFEELSYVAHQMQNFASEFPPSLHPWLARSLPLEPRQRFSSIGQQAVAFRTALDQWAQRKTAFGCTLELSARGKSEEGTNKLTDDDDQRPDSEVNQDRFQALVVREIPPRALMFVADGISTARVGTGGQAAEIVSKELVTAWEANRLIDEESLVTTLQTASEQIIQRALAQQNMREDAECAPVPDASDFMGASVTAVIVTQNTAIIAAIGDTRAYLWSAESGLWLLSKDHHVLNDRLIEGIPWSVAHGEDDAESLSRPLGAVEYQNGVWCPQKLKPTMCRIALRPDDILMVCSDGLINYLAPGATGRGRWEAEMRLSNFLAENPGQGIRKKISRLVNLANQNGGGDNITLVMLRCAEVNQAKSLATRPPEVGEVQAGDLRKQRQNTKNSHI